MYKKKHPHLRTHNSKIIPKSSKKQQQQNTPSEGETNAYINQLTKADQYSSHLKNPQQTKHPPPEGETNAYDHDPHQHQSQQCESHQGKSKHNPVSKLRVDGEFKGCTKDRTVRCTPVPVLYSTPVTENKHPWNRIPVPQNIRVTFPTFPVHSPYTVPETHWNTPASTRSTPPDPLRNRTRNRTPDPAPYTPTATLSRYRRCQTAYQYPTQS